MELQFHSVNRIQWEKAKRCFPKHSFSQWRSVWQRRFWEAFVRLSHESKLRDVPTLVFCSNPPVTFVVSFFLVTKFRWQASISQNTVSRGTKPSILSWETRAGEKLSLSEDCHRRISRTRASKKNEKRFDGSTARFPEVPFDPTVNHNRINTRNDNKILRPNVFKMNLREISK